MMHAGTCPSDWALERHLVHELPASLSTIHDHVAACDLCRAKVAAKIADNTAFSTSAGAERVREALSSKAAASSPAHAPKRASLRRPTIALLLAAALAGAFALATVHTRRVPVVRDLLADHHDEEQTVLRVQREWMEAVRDDDAAALDRILADDYTYTDSRGAVSSKADSLRLARAKRSSMTSFHTSDTKTSIHGDLAVITGRMTVEGVSRGEPYAAEIRFTDILARIDGQWRAVAAHASRFGEGAKKD